MKEEIMALEFVNESRATKLQTGKTIHQDERR